MTNEIINLNAGTITGIIYPTSNISPLENIFYLLSRATLWLPIRDAFPELQRLWTSANPAFGTGVGESVQTKLTWIAWRVKRTLRLVCARVSIFVFNNYLECRR